MKERLIKENINTMQILFRFLSVEKDRVEVEQAMEDIGNPIGLADYQLIIPQEELKKIVVEELEAFSKELPIRTETEEDSKKNNHDTNK
jgi:hypothetical protein